MKIRNEREFEIKRGDKMSRPPKRERGMSRTLVLHSAIKLFIERGYSNTKIHDIANDCGVSYNEIYRMFTDKDTLLSNLVDLVIEHQFEFTKNYLKNKTDDKLLIYAFESILQLYIAESKEHIREMYSVSYSMPSTTHKIYDFFTSKLEETFKEYLPNYSTKEFFELEMASAGIMRSYIINPCNMYFTIDRKVERFLQATLRVYRVPEEKIEETISYITQFNMKEFAKEVLDTLFEYIINRT